jgi:DNA-binding NtrC family response regulator
MDTEPKILVVDDEENLLRSVAKTLLREGFDVETADGNPNAFKMIQDSPNFEGKETKYAGLELLERLKITAPATPVIVNSAWDEVETAKMCIDKGAADYFVKGRTDEMLEKIRRVLGLEE